MTLLIVPSQYKSAIDAENNRRIENHKLRGSPVEQRRATPFELAIAWDVGGKACADRVVWEWNNGIWSPKYDVKNNGFFYDAKTTDAYPGNFIIREVHPNVIYVLGTPTNDQFTEYEVRRWAQSPMHQASKYGSTSPHVGKWTFDIFQSSTTYSAMPR